eukprot:gene1727-2070_t
MVEEVELKGVQRTQQLLERNRHLPEADRAAVAVDERHKGNEAFRSGQYDDAVEHYTVAVELYPQQVAAFANRAACYLKLRLWADALVDCDMALMLLDTSPDDSLRAKALLRRAEAFMQQSMPEQALVDYEAVLGLRPEEALAHQGLSKAQAALRQAQQQAHGQHGPGSRRMVVHETDDSEESEDEQQGSITLQQAEQQQVQEQQGNGRVAANGDDGAPGCYDACGEAAADCWPNGLPSLAEGQQGHGPAAAAIENGDVGPGGSACSSDDSTQTELEDLSSSDDEHVDDAVLASTLAAAESLPSFDSQTDQLKAAGNDAFASGLLAEAASQYAKALAHAPDASSVYLNRALVHLKLENWRAAHEDASVAIALSPVGPHAYKAFHRRSTAKQALGDFKVGAIADFEDCIRVAPSPALKKSLKQDMQLLHDASKSHLAAAVSAADKARAASWTSYGHVMIEEEPDDPEEVQEHKHGKNLAEQAALAAAAAAAKQIMGEAGSLSDASTTTSGCSTPVLYTAGVSQAARASPMAVPQPAPAGSRAARAGDAVWTSSGPATPQPPTPNPSPAVTPASSFTGSCAVQPPVMTSASLQSSMAAEVEALKDRGNQLLQQQRYEEAEAAYKEALQLDGDNVKQQDGAGALRCCDEVLAQRGEGLLKATLSGSVEAGGGAAETVIYKGVGIEAADSRGVLPPDGSACATSTVSPAAAVPGVVLPVAKAAEAAQALSDGAVRSPEDSGRRKHIRVEEEEEEEEVQQQEGQDSCHEVVKDATTACSNPEAASPPATAEAAEAPTADAGVGSAADREEQMLLQQGLQHRRSLSRLSGDMMLDSDEDQEQHAVSDTDYWSTAGFETATAANSESARAALEQLTSLVGGGGLAAGDTAPSSSSGLLQPPRQPLFRTPSPPQAGGILTGVALPDGLADKVVRMHLDAMIEALKRPGKKKYQEDNSGQHELGAQLHKKKHQCDVEREAGNEAYRKGQLQQALKHYAAAINHYPPEAKTYANRAQVWLKMKRWQMCCDDCDMALALLMHDTDKSEAKKRQLGSDQQLVVKLLLRRASAHKELGNIREARMSVLAAKFWHLPCFDWCIVEIDETDGSESADEGQEEQAAVPSAELQQQSANAADQRNLQMASSSISVTGAGQRAAQHIVQHLTPPRSSQDFCKTAKMLDAMQPTGQQQLGQYVKLLQPASYKNLFKRDLSEQALQYMVAGLAVLVMDEAAFVQHALLQLAEVERFNIVLHMVLASKAGQSLKAQLQLVMQQLQDAGQEVAGLKRLYRLP